LQKNDVGIEDVNDISDFLDTSASKSPIKPVIVGTLAKQAPISEKI